MMPVLGRMDIPKELWFEETLFMPNCLSTSYKKLLEEYKVMEVALDTRDANGPIGGKSLEETLQHFARRFGVSTCRVESLVLDPYNAFDTVSGDLLTSLSCGRVSVLDVPCGTGAVGASLLSGIATLRARGVLPKLPLDVAITGGDLSGSALDIYTKMIAELKPTLGTVGINVDLTITEWDAAMPETTARLIDTWFSKSTGTGEYLAIVANFSGEASKRYKEFESSFQHIPARLYDKKCTIVWVEPMMSGAVTFLEKIHQNFQKLIFWRSIPEKPLGYKYNWYHPFQKAKLPCFVLVQRYERR